MSWNCPGCSLSIPHAENEAAPGPAIVYRCHICRLELILDSNTNKLVLTGTRYETIEDRSERDRPTT